MVLWWISNVCPEYGLGGLVTLVIYLPFARPSRAVLELLEFWARVSSKGKKGYLLFLHVKAKCSCRVTSNCQQSEHPAASAASEEAGRGLPVSSARAAEPADASHLLHLYLRALAAIS